MDGRTNNDLRISGSVIG